jgi:large subunit ribosomal protein L29
MSKADKFRDMSDEELEATYGELNKELFSLKNDIRHTKKTEKPHLIQEKRKEIARLLTIQHEKQLAK